MKEFFLDINTQINGIYLNSETIDMLTIIQCDNFDKLRKVVSECVQFNISTEEMLSWENLEIDVVKKKLIEEYKNSLVSLEESIKSEDSVLLNILIHSGIPESEVESYCLEFKKNGYKGVVEKLKYEHLDKYEEITRQAHRFISAERDQLKSVTYDELCEINENLSNHDTLLIASGRYYNIRKKLYDKDIPNSQKYDFYHIQKELDFCYLNGKKARYHTLLDKQTLETHFDSFSKPDIIAELREYIKKSIDFINEYNAEHKIDGKGLITSVDLFNEIISFGEPYKNMWDEKYEISTEELCDIFSYAYENKPEGVTYVYNEPFLENEERRKVVIEQLKKINSIQPGLIDTIGTQMHIVINENLEDIEKSFLDFKELEKVGITTQITEFDMCLPEELIFDENGEINKKYSDDFIYEYKSKAIKSISEIIKNVDIKLDGITYWSISDRLDHNLERTNKKTYEENLPRKIATTRFAGLYKLGNKREKIEDLANDKFISSLKSLVVTDDEMSAKQTEVIGSEKIEKSEKNIDFKED